MPTEDKEHIGTATMRDDGTLVLNLRVEMGGGLGGGQKRYRRGDPHYDEVIEHIGGIEPGETKLVPRF